MDRYGLKGKIVIWIIFIIALLGLLDVLKYAYNTGTRIWANFDDKVAFEVSKEEYKTNAKYAYGYGRMWGEQVALSYEADDENFEKMTSKVDAIKKAESFLKTRDIDFVCFGPTEEDCDDLPTKKKLNELYGVKYGSDSMPYNAFKSGFIDSFIEFFDY